MTRAAVMSREAWMDGLSTGRLAAEILIPGFNTQGTPSWPWGFHDRQIPFHVVYLVTQGGMRVRWAGREAPVLPGALFWMAPNVRHDLVLLRPGTPLTSYHMRVMAKLPGGRQARLEDDVLIVPDCGGVQPLMELICEEDGDDAGPYRAARIQGLMLQLCGRMFDDERRARSGRRLTNLQQRTIRRYCESNLGKRLTSAQLASEVGLSPDYFSRRFKATFGAMPRVWLAQEKMRAAAVALTESRKPITAIAADLGYDEVYPFSRQFSRHMGCSPRTFRSRHLSGHVAGATGRP